MLNLTQSLKQIQKLSPQQIQLIKLLEIPTIQLEQRIKREIEENPVLEEGGSEDEDRDRQEEDFAQNGDTEDNYEEDYNENSKEISKLLLTGWCLTFVM